MSILMPFNFVFVTEIKKLQSVFFENAKSDSPNRPKELLIEEF